ncbi:MAG: Ig-like domain repeat protein, partial [Promethearchaeota archaeon]
VITINVSDPSGINQVKMEFKDSDHVIRNHTMTNISENAWQYDSWTPNNVDNYTYTIWMQDNFGNWDSTFDTSEVMDTTPPTYSDLIESADPLQIGQNETITIKVYDSPGSGVNQVLLEYDSSNHTMINIGGDTWRWNNWKPAKGNHSYKIYMEDMENNWNMTSGNITVVEATGPTIENFTMSEDPLELGNNVTISVDVYDNSSVDTVLIELESANYTMNHVVGNTYECTWTRSWVGTVIYVIYANDTLNNWNSFTGSFEIVDTTVPVINNLNKSEDTLELGNTIIISVNSTDFSGIALALIEYEDSDHIVRNHTMTNMTGDVWQYDSWTPGPPTGNWSYQIWVKDNNNNWGSVSDSILVQDTTLPLYSDLTESSSIVELGSELTISIKCTDLAGIKEVAIEYDNSNHTMIDMGSNIWQYNSWMPNSIGNYTYKIHITDYNNNLNYTSSSILFQDTVIPVYSNLIEDADPLELGDNQIISIDIYDFAGINQTLIEFEGMNYTMTQIDGDTWQYDSWTPNNRIIYQYRVYIEDKSGNWNFVIANFTVQDTTSPSLPILANSPSGDVSGTLLFDWEDGVDPSGILYYILIIDIETDPYSTPGYVYYINISNIGSESSYHELSEDLPLGRYYYFLAQIDGAGHQSGFTMGTFTVVSTPGNNNIMIIAIIALASVIGSLTAIVVVRKKLKKDITPQRKIIPFKLISTHINKLSSTKYILKKEKSPLPDDQSQISKEMIDEKELEFQINEIKNFGEELFTEGAYLEAQKQFKIGKDLLLSLGREEESTLFSELISGIEGLIEERERRLEILEETRIEGNSEHIFNLYQEIIDISYKLRDPDSASYYQAELIQYFQNNNLLAVDLELYRMEVSHEAELSFGNNTFAIAAQLYEKCERISRLFVQLGRDEEVAKIEEFRQKKEESLKKIS